MKNTSKSASCTNTCEKDNYFFINFYFCSFFNLWKIHRCTISQSLGSLWVKSEAARFQLFFSSIFYKSFSFRFWFRFTFFVTTFKSNNWFDLKRNSMLNFICFYPVFIISTKWGGKSSAREQNTIKMPNEKQI